MTPITRIKTFDDFHEDAEKLYVKIISDIVDPLKYREFVILYIAGAIGNAYYEGQLQAVDEVAARATQFMKELEAKTNASKDQDSSRVSEFPAADVGRKG